VGAGALTNFLHTASNNLEVTVWAQAAEPKNVVLAPGQFRQAWQSLKRAHGDKCHSPAGMTTDLDELLASLILEDIEAHGAPRRVKMNSATTCKAPTSEGRIGDSTKVASDR
jgi:hypothetical protein